MTVLIPSAMYLGVPVILFILGGGVTFGEHISTNNRQDFTQYAYCCGRSSQRYITALSYQALICLS